MSDFSQVLGLALLADYFNVSYMCARGQNLVFVCKKGGVAAGFSDLFSDHDINVKCYEHTNENFCLFEFDTTEDKDKAENFFQDFNGSIRKESMIAIPNLFEGDKNPKEYICTWYLKVIELWGEEDGNICIPFGPDEDHPDERQFFVYNQNSMVGLYRGKKLFDNYIVHIKQK